MTNFTDPNLIQKMETLTKILFKRKSRELSLKEFNEYFHSEEFLSFVCSGYSFNPSFCRAELEELRVIRNKKNRKAWLECCEEAWGWSWDSMSAKHRLGTLEHLTIAEELMVERFLVPPTYKFWIQCHSCGWVLVKAKMQDAVRRGRPCPWCPILNYPSIGITLMSPDPKCTAK